MIGSYIDPHPFTDQGEMLHARLHLSTLPFKSHLVGCILSLCLAWKKYANMTEFWILEAHIPSPFTIQREILIKILNMASSIQGAPKNVGTVFCMPLLTAFRNCFSVRIRRKFAIIPLLKIPPHLMCCYTTLWKSHWMWQTVTVFHWSCHWSLALLAWMRHPVAMWTHWPFEVKTVGCELL